MKKLFLLLSLVASTSFGQGMTFGAAGTSPLSNDFLMMSGKKFCWDVAKTKCIYWSGSAFIITGGPITMDSTSSFTWSGSGVSLVNGTSTNTGFTYSTPGGGSTVMGNGTIYHIGAVGANVSTGETTLQQALHFSQFVNDIQVAGRGLCVYASGNFANNANAKTIKVKYGPTQTDATSGLFTGTTTTTNGSWNLMCRIIRSTGAAAQHNTCTMTTSSSTAGNFVNVASGAENFATLDWSVTLTGTGGASNDILNALMRVDYCS